MMSHTHFLCLGLSLKIYVAHKVSRRQKKRQSTFGKHCPEILDFGNGKQSYLELALKDLP
jgi:hypothetical protein